MISGLISKVMGSQLTKNYEVDKEPYMHGGLHNLWKVYRGKKKDRGNMDVSLFIFEKKILDKKKLSQTHKDDIFNILKKDPQNLAKLRHPSLLSLIEQPMEDQKYLIYVTEPVEFNLASLQFDATKKELIPGDLEIKCQALELMEALNFLHNNAKMIHMGLAPEHVYITKDGKLKLGGLNFAQQFSTAESLNVPLNYDLKINEYSVVPNLRFAAPELTDQQQCSVNSDLFSVGTILYFMVALNKSKGPFLLNQADITDKQSHTFECGTLQKKLGSFLMGFESDFDMLIRKLTNSIPNSRGSVNNITDNSWFQDPLLKTIKYLETLDSKDHLNKVQFLQGITRILEKFDKKALIKKVIPLLLDQMKLIQLSVNVLPNILEIMERPNFLTTTEFRDAIWPHVQKLCKAKELPAQSLFLILKNTELFMKFVGPKEFQDNFLILINKSLECGVAKLQFLALTKVPLIIKQIEYNTVKTSIIPRILMILEKPAQVQLKQKTLEILLEIINIIDSQTMKDKILKTFEKVRASETDPQICMYLLKIYEQMAKVLGVEEIGLKILPGIIPMLISGTFTRNQFKEMISSVRRLLDQIEQHREKDLREMGQEQNADSAFDMDGLEKSLGLQKSVPESQVTNKDVFDFLSSLERGSGSSGEQHSNNFGSGNIGGGSNDIMNTINSIAQQKPQAQSDPFAGFQPQNQPQQQNFGGFSQIQSKANPSSGWDADIPLNLGGGSQIKPLGSGSKLQEDDFFNSIAGNNKQQQNTNINFGNPMTLGGNTSSQRSSMPNNQGNNVGAMNLNFSAKPVGNLGKLNDDPFAELIEGGSSGSGPQINQPGLNLGFNSSAQSQGAAGGSSFGTFGHNQNQFTQSTIPNFNQGASTGFNMNQNIGGGALNNIGGGFGQSSQGNTFGIQQQQQNQFSGMGGFGGNTGAQSQNLGFGGASTFGQFPAPKQNQQSALGNDDFFSQFTNVNSSNQQQQKNSYGNLF